MHRIRAASSSKQLQPFQQVWRNTSSSLQHLQALQPWGHKLCWGIGVALTSHIGQPPVLCRAGASLAAGLKVLG